MTKKKGNYTIQLDPDFVERIDKLADKLGMSRGQLMRNCLLTGFDDALMLDKIGLLQAINYIQKLRDFKQAIYEVEVTIEFKVRPKTYQVN